MVKRVNALVKANDAELVVLDPAVPLGLIGPHLDVPYDVVLHGAEVTIPGRLPVRDNSSTERCVMPARSFRVVNTH